MASPDGPPSAKRLKGEAGAVLRDEHMTDAGSPVGAVVPAADRDDFSTWSVQNLMKLYYSRLFPHQHFYRWLAYGNDSKHAQADPGYFQRREFCFTLDGDIFVRYQSFKDGSELQAALISKLPSKIDIGPMYNVDPARRTAYTGTASDRGFSTVERELVFDIDLTDYDDVRTCGSGGHICNDCWPLMAVAIQVMDRGLRDDFGFEQILWVFSGRRGVHCWVSDTRARLLTDEQRSAVAAYFSIYKGQEDGLAKLALTAHDAPCVQRAYEVLKTAWLDSVLPRQGLLENEQQMAAILEYVPDNGSARESLQRAWQTCRPRPGEEDINLQRWHKVVEVCEKEAKRAQDKRLKGAFAAAPKRIVIAYTYPRLDIEVSKKMNHLLKAPFCIHPKTGKVCVPLDPKEAATFDPETVPTVGKLLTELNSNPRGPLQKGEEWRATAMADAVEVFENCFLRGVEGASKEALAAKARVAAAKPTLAW